MKFDGFSYLIDGFSSLEGSTFALDLIEPNC